MTKSGLLEFLVVLAVESILLIQIIRIISDVALKFSE